MNVHIHYHYDPDEIGVILKEIKLMAATLDDLVTKVAALKTVDDSAVALLQGLSAQLKAAHF